MRIILFLLIIQLLSNTSTALAQDDKPIYDFYQFANKTWLDSTILPENYVVINQAGILWKEIEKKTIDILTSCSTYGLDEEHLFALNQLRKFYESTSEIDLSEKERLQLVQKSFPTILGIIFSETTIDSQKEEMINELIKYITLAYRHKIKNSNIIGDYYKKLFQEKIDSLKFEIGAPSISDFPRMPVLSKDSYNANLQAANLYHIETAKVKSDWRTPPYETDCFYSVRSNKIKLYAGMLLDFNSNDNPAYLFATLGRTIAHEMTHAFDIAGKNYDKNGKRITWLKKMFSGGIHSYNNWDDVYYKIINQYNHYAVHDSLFIDGKKTLQENIADIGGVEISILALNFYLTANYKNISENERDDYLKQYFLNYASFWKEKGTKEFEIASTKRKHTPQKFRAIGPIYNQNEFYRIFNIDKKSGYYIPEENRVTIW